MNLQQYAKTNLPEHDFSQNFNEQFHELQHQGVGGKTPGLTQASNHVSGVDLAEKAKGFNEGQFNMFEPHKMMAKELERKEQEGAKSSQAPAAQAKRTTPKNRGNRSMSTSRLGESAEINEELAFGLITAPSPGMAKVAATSQIQHGPSSGGTISDQLSHLAVIDNQNTLNINIQHERVKGYKQDSFIKGSDPSRAKADEDQFRSANGERLDDDMIFDSQLEQQLKSAYRAAQSFTGHLNIASYLIDSLKKFDKFELDNQTQIKEHLELHGLYLFGELNDHVASATKSSEDQRSEKISQGTGNIKHKSNQKCRIESGDDYKEWEQYDTYVKRDGADFIPIDVLPQYIKAQIVQGPKQPFAFDEISSFMCGQKCGKSISDPDNRWVEEWFEVECADIAVPSQQQEEGKNQDNTGAGQDKQRKRLTIKSLRKLWVNREQHLIEGQSNFQVLAGGHGRSCLVFELRDEYKCENILDKEGSLRQKPISVSKKVPKVSKVVKPTVIVEQDQDAGKPMELNLFPELAQKQAIADLLVKQDEALMQDYEEVAETQIVADKYANSDIPLRERPIRVSEVRKYLTQFDGSNSSSKVREEGIEHAWVSEDSTQYKTGNWQAIHQGKRESVKEIRTVETDPKVIVDPNLKSGSREGLNEHGEAWTEEWKVNEVLGYKRWAKSNTQYKEQRSDGFDRKESEWREERRGEQTTGEKSAEMTKVSDDYWEKRSTRYTEYAKKIVQNLATAIDDVLEAPTLIRSGITDFHNNRNFFEAEHWEEYVDGTVLKKKVHDTGYGTKTMSESGQKLNINRLPDVQLLTNAEGYFQQFKDGGGNSFSSLQDMLEKKKEFLAWEYKNTTTETIEGDEKMERIYHRREGHDFVSGEEWENTKRYTKHDNSEEVVNRAKDASGEWSESYSQNGRERWSKKEGRRGGQQWREQWYRRACYDQTKKATMPTAKKRDEFGNELSEDESVASELSECNCEKWGRNEDGNEEWNEKWGELHRAGQKQKWCDKWTMELSTGLKKGENWGQTYNDHYEMKEHWAEKWDNRHPENDGVYEKRHEYWAS